MVFFSLLSGAVTPPEVVPDGSSAEHAWVPFDQPQATEDLAGPASDRGVIRMMPLGDSITIGSDGGYRTMLFNSLNYLGYSIDFVGSLKRQKNWPYLPDHDHEGHGGWRINTIERNITDWIAQYQPDVIFLHIGTNDISNNESAISVARQLSGLIETIYTAKPEVVLYVASVILRTDSAEKARVTDEYAALTPLVVESWAAMGYAIHFVDMHSELTAADLADHLHPNAIGYDKMGLVWALAYQGTPTDLPLHMTVPHRGKPATLTVRNAEPGAEVRFYATTSTFGSTLIEDLAVYLDINAPKYLGSAVADGLGVAVLEAEVPYELAGNDVRVQAAAVGRTSQVLVKAVRW
ncbi:MAG: hypothetical protein D8M59_01545 [Planctomycetes bacterium]|nr:hypothetical protein [Planctomycetota bacterium]NOG54594.1 hypothetical protein [Planctomycetota bacterium]